MRDKDLQFDRTCHVLYSKPCKREIQSKIALLYPPRRAGGCMGAGAKAICALSVGPAHGSRRQKEFPQRQGRQLRLHCTDGVLCCLQRAYKPCGNRADGWQSVSRKIQKNEIFRLQQAVFKRLMYRAFLNTKKQCDRWDDTRLVRTTTCVNGDKCDYTICGDRDEYLNEHPEYRDEHGYRRNK